MTLDDFIQESNRIEGIIRPPTVAEVQAHAMILRSSEITPIILEEFVSIIQPGAKLRYQAGMNVRVGNHIAQNGGPKIASLFRELLEIANGKMARGVGPFYAYDLHHVYETLHPFMDGNGRSGRVFWLWMMGGVEAVPLGFLHTWYYQSLEKDRA